MINLKHSIMLWMLLVMNSTTAFSIDYRKVFGNAWNEAECYVCEHHEKWKQEFELFGVAVGWQRLSFSQNSSAIPCGRT